MKYNYRIVPANPVPKVINPSEKQPIWNDSIEQVLDLDSNTDNLHSYTKNIVKIFNTRHTPNFEMPWQNKKLESTFGTGFVISNRMIVTNAHVVDRAVNITVQLHGRSVRHTAEIFKISHQHDLAILKVTQDPNVFFDITDESGKKIEPLEISNIFPRLHDRVTVIGYPIGGSNITMTRGIVSRIDLTTIGLYNNLSIQVDAPINPGNSGGPVFYKDKLIGVAFGGLSNTNNVGYIIPTPVIQDFLSKINENRIVVYDPGFSYDYIVNTDAMDYYKVDRSGGGIRIKRVVPNHPISKVLKSDDVLIEIDGHAIGFDGTFELFPGIRILFTYLFFRKQKNDPITLKISRNGQIMILKTTPAISKPLIPVKDGFDFMPKYYAFAGFLFVPLTHPLIVQLYGSIDKVPGYLYEFLDKDLLREDEEIICLVHIFPTEQNTGYVYSYPIPLEKINGKKIYNLKDIYDITKNNPEPYLKFDFHNEIFTIVLKTQSARSNQNVFLNQYNIPKEYLNIIYGQ
jgi:S1-C subfamily serine protease